MANVPTIPSISRIQAVPLGVKQNAAPALNRLNAQRGAIAAGVDAIGEVTGAIATYEHKKQEAEDVAAFNQASIVLNKTTADYRRNLKTMPDQKIVENWTEVTAKTKEQILQNSAGLSAAAKTKLGLNLDTWASNSTIEFQVAADHLGSQRRSAITHAAVQEFASTGDPEMMRNAKAAVDATVKAGDWTPEQAAIVVGSFPRILQENQVRNGMEANPISTLKDIEEGKFSHIPPGPLMTLKRQTQQAVTVLQSAGRDELLSRFDSGEIIDPSEIQQREQAGALSPTGARGVRNAIAQKGIKEAKDDHALLMMRTDDHDWVQDKLPDKTAQELKDDGASLPLTLRKSLYAHIEAKVNASKKAGAAEQRPVEKEVFDRMKEDREDNGLTIPMAAEITEKRSGVPITGWFARDASVKYSHLGGGLKALRDLNDKQIKATFGEDATLAKVIAAEELHYAQQLGKMRSWLKANPEATDEKAENYRKTLERPYIMAGATRELLKNVPTAITTQQELDALPAGAAFIFDGRLGTKN